MIVVGMGEKKTPSAFISACHQFKYLEILLRNAEEKNNADAPSETSQQRTDLAAIKRTVLTIIDEVSDEDEWIFISEIGDILVKRYPDFDVRNYGFKKLTPFLKSLNILDIRSTRTSDGNNRLVYVRAKKNHS